VECAAGFSDPRRPILLRQAIREGWPVPFERRAPIVAKTFRGFSDDSPARQASALGRLATAAELQTLALGREAEGTRRYRDRGAVQHFGYR
jgi:hypothetical protein